ncbi:hypothetical protein C7974DRAFT_379402 [Boeremia exigua]|uniref:uncharacterized protein n=1 Tax=Boeremia exigua TaxID=749465 RepID=UPI001E8CFCD9|nr:uncharacterized protein C7974DRAFT_379402 [Boeremia exigua]KAH6616506.1 hypothetical protein C7974DRAFT_379402 [Boeremia exigua]
MFYPWGWLLFAAASLVLVSSTMGRYFMKASPTTVKLDSKENPEDAYYNIEPLVDFDLAAEEPIQARPFKPKFHMTMATENITLSNLLAMDNTYASRLALRRSLVATHRPEIIAANPRAAPAITELYAWLTQTYLPTRHPSLYTLTPSGLRNHTTSTTLPLAPTPDAALEHLATNIDTDFLLLLPSSAPADAGKYRLEAFATCFPSGFRTASKLGLLLADIHGPVPHYRAKLELSMDRFFAALPVGKIVRRWNWAVSTTGDLFCVSGNHATAAQAAAEIQRDEVDLRTTFLRCERQTLHRLPASRALVFAFKTYQYPIAEVRRDSAREMAEAIDGLGGGSAPEMRVYKREVVWGEKVKAFLRGEIGEDD